MTGCWRLVPLLTACGGRAATGAGGSQETRDGAALLGPVAGPAERADDQAIDASADAMAAELDGGSADAPRTPDCGDAETSGAWLHEPRSVDEAESEFAGRPRYQRITLDTHACGYCWYDPQVGGEADDCAGFDARYQCRLAWAHAGRLCAEGEPGCSLRVCAFCETLASCSTAAWSDDSPQTVDSPCYAELVPDGGNVGAYSDEEMETFCPLGWWGF